jgi:fructose-bisphosphate aldolase class I
MTEPGSRTNPLTPETTMTDRDRQLHKMHTADGFIAALDQSGGSTPGALSAYGVPETAWSTEEEMFDRVHEMRTRIMTDAAFEGDRIIGAILFENTMARDVEGRPTARYLWEVREVVPFLKVDQGKEPEQHGVELMKPMTRLDALLDRAEERGIFGTKMRSVVNQANEDGIRAIVAQQFDEGLRIVERGFVPILEPEVNIHCPEKEKAEGILHDLIMEHLDELDEAHRVMLKLTLPEADDLYADCIAHPQVVRVVALSGGYSRDEATDRLAAQKGMIASFSRALLEGLSADQSDDDFHQTLDRSVQSIFEASTT